MNAALISAFQTLPIHARPALESALSELLASLSSSGPLSIKSARDGFTKVNRLAREGQVQLVRGQPGEETVLVSVKDLATIIQTAAARLTLDDALSISGFTPAGGRFVHEECFVADEALSLAEHVQSGQGADIA
jgi:hypothetical protein